MKYLLILLLVCCFCSSLSSQIIDIKRHNRYIFEGITYNKKEIAFAFIEDSESLSVYQKAISLSKSSRGLAFTALGGFLAGNALLVFSVSQDGFDLEVITFSIVIAYIAAPVLAIISIPVALSGRAKLNKAINFHNHEYIELNGYQIDQSHLDLGFSTNGLGLFYTF